MGQVLAASALGYLAFLLMTIFGVDRLVPLNDRILSPLLLLLLQAAILGLAAASLRYGRPGRWAAAAVTLAFLAGCGVRQTALVRSLRDDGQGYAARTWRESDVLHFVCGLPEIPIYSNDLPAVYFACGRYVRPLPSPWDSGSNIANPDFTSQVDSVTRAVRDDGALIVVIGWYGEPRLAELGIDRMIAGLRPQEVFDDGIVFAR
jgi:hypothetical protein